MKHEKINGQLLNMDKKWQHLHCQQSEWIVNQFRLEYVTYLNKYGEHPRREGCQEIVGAVYEKMRNRGIWLPYGELKRAFSSKLPRYRKIDIALNR